MEYLKLQRSYRKGDAWGAASMNNRGVWTSLAGFCADEENSGRLRGARTWPVALWQRRIGCTQDELTEAIDSGMAAWDGDDLVVAGYDVVGEQAYQAKRKLGKDAGEASGRARRKYGRSTWSEPSAQPSGEPDAQPTGEPHGSTESEPHGSTTRSTARSTEPEPQPEPISITSDQGQRRPARARDPRILVVVALGGLFEGDDGIDLTPRWTAAIGDLTEPLIRAVFEAGPRILKHGIRYPSGFTDAHAALVAEEDARNQHEQRQRAAREQDTEKQRCARMLGRVKAWLASEDGEAIRAKLSAIDRDGIAALEDGNPYGFLAVTKKHPELARVAADESRGAA